MKTFFYNRSGYRLLNTVIPQCFMDLDDHFNTRFTTLQDSVAHPSVRLAENLCRRMADVEIYASAISDAQKNPDIWKGAILIGTSLVGYFTACKALFDAGSVTLANLYALPLSNKQMDFSKKKFWKVLEQKAPQVQSRYKLFQNLFEEVVLWRDAAVHRLTPLAVPQGPGHPDQVVPENMEIKMVAKPDADLSTLVRAPASIQWVEPLYFHKKWQPRLIALCEEVCSDIRDRT